MPTEGESIVYEGSSSPTDPQRTLRLLHYNDVYHVEPGSREPVGGVARFQHLANYYRSHDSFKDQPKLVTLFSGDAFNPSLESSCTKGTHMVPLLNNIGTDIACLGNHDLDFGITQFQHLASQCNFPWLLGNVLDLDLGDDVPLGGIQKTAILTASNGIKIGVLGLVEREWLATINSLPPNLKYVSAAAAAKELVPKLREQGADIVIAITHARQPNDEKLANNIPQGFIDIILGGHDHDYAHSVLNGIHLLRSGTDFRQFSYINAWQTSDNKWDFKITRRDLVSSLPEDEDTVALVQKLTASLKAKMDKPIGYTAAPLDGRFSTVRRRESNLGNFICDLMRLYYQADCSLMAAGTIRGDQVYPPGVLRLKDIMNCFPFEDPVVVLKISGEDLLKALENGVSTYPALEGRFPQVSNIKFEFDPQAKVGSRLTTVKIGSEPLDRTKFYRLATRSYMAKGKDGYESLLVESEGGTVEELVPEENGILISMILRQYFNSLKIVGRWAHWGPHIGQHWGSIHKDLHGMHPVRESSDSLRKVRTEAGETYLKGYPTPQHASEAEHAQAAMDSDSEDELDSNPVPPGARLKSTPAGWKPADGKPAAAASTSMGTAASASNATPAERQLVLMRKVIRKWWRLAGLTGQPRTGHEEEGEFVVAWTKTIAPRVEDRITMVGGDDS